jgi:hypothetical protein
MAIWRYHLIDPPAEPRARELWLQHAAGFIVFEVIRRYAIEQIDPKIEEEARSADKKGDRRRRLWTEDGDRRSHGLSQTRRPPGFHRLHRPLHGA